MSESIKSSGVSSVGDVTVDFGSRFAESDLFNQIFREGMGLVESTASYLDGPGREESRDLGRNAAMAYATESMRLTTRLMQLASWLLLQRAVKDGEMTSEEARNEKYRINLSEATSVSRRDTFEELPNTLLDLIVQSERLHKRIVHLDEMLGTTDKTKRSAAASSNPVSDQVTRLQAAFATPGAKAVGD